MEMKQTNLALKIVSIVFIILSIILISLGLSLYFFIGKSDSFTDSQRLLLLIPLFPGLIFLLTGIPILIYHQRSVKRVKWFKENGIRYPAEITDIYEKTFGVVVNNRHPYAVECTYINSSGETVLVKSGSIWPTYRFHLNNISANVLLDPQNPQNYYVEIISSPAENYYDRDHR